LVFREVENAESGKMLNLEIFRKVASLPAMEDLSKETGLYKKKDCTKEENSQTLYDQQFSFLVFQPFNRINPCEPCGPLRRAKRLAGKMHLAFPNKALIDLLQSDRKIFI
jgi:hypothetical protein